MKRMSMLEVFKRVGEKLEQTDNLEIRQIQYEYRENNKEFFTKDGKSKHEAEVLKQLNKA